MYHDWISIETKYQRYYERLLDWIRRQHTLISIHRYKYPTRSHIYTQSAETAEYTQIDS